MSIHFILSVDVDVLHSCVVASCNRDHVALKTKILIIWPFGEEVG
jgi:hypothetical protein